MQSTFKNVLNWIRRRTALHPPPGGRFSNRLMASWRLNATRESMHT